MISMKFALGCAGLMALAAGYAQAQAVGPTPSVASTTQVGPFAVTTQQLTGQGFRGGTIFVPTGAGPSPEIAFVPGFTLRQATNQTVARRIASFGFVVVTIDTNSTLDNAQSRGTQLMAALRALQAVGGAAGATGNDNALGVAGHSMGGGGAYFALLNQANIGAATMYAPFSSSNPFGGIRGRVISSNVANNDNTAPGNRHAIPFFNSTNANNNAVLGQLATGGHNVVSAGTINGPASRLAIAAFSVGLRNDARFAPILANGTGFATFRP